MAPTMVKELVESNAQPEEAFVPTNEEIAKLAYILWEARGGVGGSSEEDWLHAQAELSRV